MLLVARWTFQPELGHPHLSSNSYAGKKEEINRLLGNKHIEPIEYSEWDTPIVAVLKPDGTVCLWVDFWITINKYFKIDHFPWPIIKNIILKLPGNNYVSE